MKKLTILFSALLIAGLSQAQESEVPEGGPEAAEDRSERYHHRGGRGKRVKAMLKRVDTNQDGKVDLNEFLANAEARFQKMDLDSDGYVTAEERREVGKKMREKHREMREKHREQRKLEREQRQAEQEASE